MDKEQMFTVIKQIIVEVIPELSNKTIVINDSLREIGANSIDRAEILIKCMAATQLTVPLTEFAGAKNIEELVDIFLKQLQMKNT